MIDTGDVTLLLVSAAVLGFILVLKRYGKRESRLKHPQSLPALPIVGSLPFLRCRADELPEHFLQLSRKLGPVFSFYSGRKVAIVLNGKQAIVDALLKHAEAFADRSELWTEANILNTELRGIGFTHYNEAFKKNRKLTLSIMREFGFGVSHESDIRIWIVIEKLIEMIRDYNGRSFDPKILMVRMTANVVMNILFGEEFQTMEKDLHKIVDGANEYLGNMDLAFDMVPLLRFLPRYRKKIENMKRAKESIFQGLEAAIEHNKSVHLNRGSFTRRYLEIEGPDYDHQDLLFLLRDICLGSSDTTSLRLLWSVVEMVNHPDVRVRVQKEIDEVIPGDRLPSYEDRLRLPYTEATMLEIARLHTLSPIPIPRSTLKDTECCGYFIPKGCLILPNVHSTLMDPAIWSDPAKFRPERFLDKDLNVIGRDSVFQFGLGKRSCLGESLARQEVFIFFCCLMQHFDMQPPDGQSSITVANEPGLTVGPAPFQMRFIPRK